MRGEGGDAPPTGLNSPVSSVQSVCKLRINRHVRHNNKSSFPKCFIFRSPMGGKQAKAAAAAVAAVASPKQKQQEEVRDAWKSIFGGIP